MDKIVAIMSGGDWYDASVHHLILPEGIEIEAEFRAYRDWFDRVYSRDMEYISFSDWLLRRGARLPCKDELVEFWED